MFADLFLFFFVGPKFAGFPIPYDSENDLNIFIQGTQNVSSVASNLQSRGCNPQILMSVVPNWRYSTAYWCSRTVSDAITKFNCPLPDPNTVAPFLCSAECAIFTNAVKDAYNNATICPDSTQAATRASKADEIQGYCSTFTQLGSTSSNCIHGLSSEATTCGMNYIHIYIFGFNLNLMHFHITRIS